MEQRVNVSVVIPVRDGNDRITARLAGLFTALEHLETTFEVIVVDDGSRDSTPEVLHRLVKHHSQLRVVRHARPRGMEAAGRSGVERAIGELIFIQESDEDVRIEDLKRLYRLSDDESVVAARAESARRPISSTLLQSIRNWSRLGNEPVASRIDSPPQIGLQMIRRPHLRLLSSPRGQRYRLHGETLHASTVEPFTGEATRPPHAASTAPPTPTAVA